MSTRTSPAYCRLSVQGKLEERVQRAYRALQNCKLCPRRCGVNRIEGELGFCRTGKNVKAIAYGPYENEEALISGRKGSGLILFSRCNLACVYCQNYKFSQQDAGDEITPGELAGLMLDLQKRGVHNINLVTPSHVVPQIIAATAIAAREGLKIPLVFNSNGYDSIKALKLLDGIVDIYLPDFKYSSAVSAQKYSFAKNYWSAAKKAVAEMYRQVGLLKVDSRGVAYRGIIIRHLVLPENVSGAKRIFEYIASSLSKNVCVSIMNQYFPAYKTKGHAILGRSITQEELQEVVSAARAYGLRKVLIQELKD